MSITIPVEILFAKDAIARSFYLSDEQWQKRLRIFGFAVVGVLANCVLAFLNQVPLGWICLQVISECVGCLVVSLALLPCVRVDDQGVSLRRLWWWDTWLWQDFSDRNVRQGTGFFGYYRDDRLVGCRLRLDQLEDEDAIVLNEIILRYYRVPDGEPFHSDCILQMNWPDSRTVELTSTDIRVSSGHRETTYLWSEVRRASIWRFEPRRTDFKELCLQLPDQYLRLERRIRSDDWTGCAAESICEMVCQRVDNEHLEDFSLHCTPRSIAELSARWTREWLGLQQHLQQLAQAAQGLAILACLSLVALFMLQDHVFLICILSVFGFLWGNSYVYRLTVTSAERKRIRYENLRQQLDGLGKSAEALRAAPVKLAEDQAIFR